MKIYSTTGLKEAYSAKRAGSERVCLSFASEVQRVIWAGWAGHLTESQITVYFDVVCADGTVVEVAFKDVEGGMRVSLEEHTGRALTVVFTPQPPPEAWKVQRVCRMSSRKRGGR